MTTTINDRLIPTAYELASGGAIRMAEQDEFSQLHLDETQRQAYLDLCCRVRECRITEGQRLLDAIVEIIGR